MNYLDILLLSIILICFATGLKSGLIRQVFFFVSIVGGLVLGFVFYEPVGSYLLENKMIVEPKLASIAGFVLVSSLSYLFIQVVSRFLTDLIKKLHMGWFNNLLGAVVGTVVGILLCYLTILGVTQFTDEDSSFVKDSVLMPKIIEIYDSMKKQAPVDLYEPVEKLREFREKPRQSGVD